MALMAMMSWWCWYEHVAGPRLLHPSIRSDCTRRVHIENWFLHYLGIALWRVLVSPEGMKAIYLPVTKRMSDHVGVGKRYGWPLWISYFHLSILAFLSDKALNNNLWWLRNGCDRQEANTKVIFLTVNLNLRAQIVSLNLRGQMLSFGSQIVCTLWSRFTGPHHVLVSWEK